MRQCNIESREIKCRHTRCTNSPIFSTFPNWTWMDGPTIYETHILNSIHQNLSVLGLAILYLDKKWVPVYKQKITKRKPYYTSEAILMLRVHQEYKNWLLFNNNYKQVCRWSGAADKHRKFECFSEIYSLIRKKIGTHWIQRIWPIHDLF